MISLEGISKSYGDADKKFSILKDLSLTVNQGEFISIMGTSGSGKSTLMNILGLISKPTSGSYFFDGIDVLKANQNSLANIRNDAIGFVFQSFNLLSHLNSIENVGLPLYFSKINYSENKIQELSRIAMNQVGLDESLFLRKPLELSGGQQQRVAIARAIVNSPRVLFADEPTGSLDFESSEEILNLLVSLNATLKMTIVLITHDQKVAKHCKRNFLMSKNNFTEQL